MSKALTILGMAIAVLLFALFVLDLATQIPFGPASLWMDIGLSISALILGYLSWTAYKEQG